MHFVYCHRISRENESDGAKSKAKAAIQSVSVLSRNVFITDNAIIFNAHMHRFTRTHPFRQWIITIFHTHVTLNWDIGLIAIIHQNAPAPPHVTAIHFPFQLPFCGLARSFCITISKPQRAFQGMFGMRSGSRLVAQVECIALMNWTTVVVAVRIECFLSTSVLASATHR